MPDSLAARYNATPYRHGAIQHSHPARMGAIGRLHGLNCAPPDRCRVLELGCAEGANLLPLAERFPDSQFLGVDFSQVAIATAEATRDACGLGNARFECADLRAFEPEPGGYDYVIAHGVYSWVPDDVKERLLATCLRALAPGGVAYISYNTLPGWGLPGGLRAFLLEEIEQAPDATAKIERARRVLASLEEASRGQPGAYAAHLRSAVEDLLRKPPTLLFHDDLAPVNDPCTFTHFVDHTAKHGLRYLAEAHYATMHFGHTPAPMRAALAGLELDFLREQQYLDVLFQRWLRDSLLCREEPRREPALELIRECAIGARLRVDAKTANLRPGATLTMKGPNDMDLVFADPIEKAVLIVLVMAGSARVPFATAIANASGMLFGAGIPAIRDDAPVLALLYRLFSIDALDLVLAGDGRWLAEGAGPSPLMRHEAERGFTITNRWHEPVGVTIQGQQWLVESSGGENRAARFAGFMV
jgi:SAM-dependent methyltransferase